MCCNNLDICNMLAKGYIEHILCNPSLQQLSFPTHLRVIITLSLATEYSRCQKTMLQHIMEVDLTIWNFHFRDCQIYSTNNSLLDRINKILNIICGPYELLTFVRCLCYLCLNVLLLVTDYHA